jgi:hypothetical protein
VVLPSLKGQSGNPGGRPKTVLEDGRTVADIARQHTCDAIETLAEVMRDVATPPSARIAAATALLDRAWGRPGLPVQVATSYEPSHHDPEAARAAIARYLEREKQRQAELLSYNAAAS